MQNFLYKAGPLKNDRAKNSFFFSLKKKSINFSFGTSRYIRLIKSARYCRMNVNPAIHTAYLHFLNYCHPVG